MPFMDFAKDVVPQALMASALVEYFKDIYPGASANVKRLATLVAGIVIAALVTWKTGMPWNEYLTMTIAQAFAITVAATLGYVGVQSGASALVPPVPTVAETAAKIAATRAADVTARAKAAAEHAQLVAEQPATALLAQPVPEPPPPPVVTASPVVPRVPRERDLPGGPA